MRIIDAAQGTPEWLAVRARHLCASDAPAVMGVSRYKSRQDLIREKAIGSVEEVTPDKQRIFNRGHEAEASIRPHVEALIGDELYPITGAAEIHGLPLLASFDGLTLDNSVGFEHKLLNGSNAAKVEAGEVPEEHVWQLEHQMLVGGMDAVVFAVSDGSPETLRTCTYVSDPEKRARLIAGWKQFVEDVQNYQHVESAPAPEGRAPETLPALRIEVKGMVASSNLAEFQAHAMSVIGSISTDLQTDEDFASAEKTVKWCADVEQRLEAAKSAALSQTADIDDLFRTIDSIREEARAKRLTLEKSVKSRKESIRAEIVDEGKKAIESHCKALDASLGVALPRPLADFTGAIKGKKLLSAMRDAIATTLAAAKIEANETADRIRANLSVLAEHPDHRFLFADLAAIVTKAQEDFSATVKLRIAEHQAKVAAQENEKREAAEAEERYRQEQAEQKKQEIERRIAQAEQESRDALARAENEKAEAQRRAEQAAKDAEERVKREAEEKAAAEKAEAEKRERNTRHRAKIHREAAAAISAAGLDEAQAKAVVTLIAKGAVPNISIQY